MKVLITGGTGFLGCHLARTLLEKHMSVVLYDISPLDATDLEERVDVISGDIRDRKKLLSAMKGVTHVVHAAAALPIQKDKKTITSVNVTGTKIVLESALTQKVKRVVFVSSTAVCGIPMNLPETEASPLNPIGDYGESKVAGEKLCAQFMKKGLEITIIRPKTFLGEERLGVFELWFEAIYTNRKVYILGKGNNRYQLLAVTDLCQAIYKALTTNITNQIFTIGAKEFQTWRKDLGAVIKKAKSHSQITSLPTAPSQLLLQMLEKLRLSPLAAWHYKTMPVDSYVSIEKAERLLKWHPTKSNQELLIENYEWYKKHRHEFLYKTGKTHRVGWNFKILNLLSRF